MEGARTRPWRRCTLQTLDRRSMLFVERADEPSPWCDDRQGASPLSDNESCFFLMADYASDMVDIREQFPLFPESATQRVASSLGVRHPNYPRSRTPIVMTTDFLLTKIDKSGKRYLIAFSIKSAEQWRACRERRFCRTGSTDGRQRAQAVMHLGGAAAPPSGENNEQCFPTSGPSI